MRISLRIWIIVVAGSFLVSAATCLILAYLHEPKFEKIYEGMTREEVEACLGKPSWEFDSDDQWCALIYQDGFWQKRHASFNVHIDRNTDKVTRTYVVDIGPDERGFIERIRDRLKSWARKWL